MYRCGQNAQSASERFPRLKEKKKTVIEPDITMSTIKSTSYSDKCHLTDLLHANMLTDMLTETGVAKLLTSWCLHTIDLV